MRQVQNPQKQLGELDIGAISLDTRSRDDIPKLLLGLQHIYSEPALREAVFQLLEEVKPRNAAGEPVSSENGRPRMEHKCVFDLVMRFGDLDVPKRITRSKTHLKKFCFV